MSIPKLRPISALFELAALLAWETIQPFFPMLNKQEPPDSVAWHYVQGRVTPYFKIRISG
jgi:hypothetical protein